MTLQASTPFWYGEGSFPVPTDGDSPIWLPYAVKLCLISSVEPPPLFERRVKELAGLVSDTCREGCTGITLSWPGQEHRALDGIPHPSQDTILQEWGILPSNPSHDLPESGWAPEFTWLGLLPSRLPEGVKERLSALPEKARQDLIRQVAITIISSQFDLWATARSLIVSALQAHRAHVRAKGKGVWLARAFSRPMCKPIGLRIVNAVAAARNLSEPPTREEFLTTCLSHGVPRRFRALAWQRLKSFLPLSCEGAHQVGSPTSRRSLVQGDRRPFTSSCLGIGLPVHIYAPKAL